MNELDFVTPESIRAGLLVAVALASLVAAVAFSTDWVARWRGKGGG